MGIHTQSTKPKYITNDQRSQFDNDSFSQKKFAMENLNLYLPYLKSYFQKHLLSAFFFMAQQNHIISFLGMLLLERSKIKVWEPHLFKKIICYGSFELMSAFCEKVFSGAPVKGVFLYDSNNSHSVILGNTSFGEIKDHSLKTTLFQRKILL